MCRRHDRHFPKKGILTEDKLTDTWKDAQKQSSSWKYKYNEILVLYLSEWLILTSQETPIDVGEEIEKGEPSYIVGGNTN